ncbi:hypothetical protein NPX13_g7453 [Xylaria arbuscula]|uniref:Uncharacterized protein n=1 Tax=Xylaria arbuscula TaxID=114810 RepID=A0A9W8NAB6_9PEZI|nr:hypothetical protein NPX13_g7453 [Xylaria arbuscula]
MRASSSPIPGELSTELELISHSLLQSRPPKVDRPCPDRRQPQAAPAAPPLLQEQEVPSPRPPTQADSVPSAAASHLRRSQRPWRRQRRGLRISLNANTPLRYARLKATHCGLRPP